MISATCVRGDTRIRRRAAIAGKLRLAACEALEDRRLLSAYHAPAGAVVIGRTTPILPRPDDEVLVSFVGGSLYVTGTRGDDLALQLGANDDGQVTLGGAPARANGRNIPARAVRRIVVRGNAGDDDIDLSGISRQTGFTSLVGTSVQGGEGRDTITGSALRDVLLGGADTDAIAGGDGNDLIYGQGGWNDLQGQGGNDRLVGGPDGDILYGGDGDDHLVGLGGNDMLYASGYGSGTSDIDEGSDTLDGGAGNDRFYWGASAAPGDFVVRERRDEGIDGLHFHDLITTGINVDLSSARRQSLGDGGTVQLVGAANFESMFGTDGNDTLGGNAADNHLEGGDGNDLIFGGAGNDLIGGDAGDDHQIGGLGNDDLWAGPGDDVLAGGDGDDRYVLFGAYPFGGERIVEPAGLNTDTIDLAGAAGDVALDFSSTHPQELLVGVFVTLSDSAGIEDVILPENDFFDWTHAVTGNARPNRIVGGPNGDTLDGAGGDDTVIGNGGDDVIIGGTGRDSLVGGAGADAFDADDDEIDVLHGGDGSDSILSQDDQDVLQEIP